MSILVVDSIKENRDMLIELLSGDYSISIAEDDLPIGSDRPSLILLDIKTQESFTLLEKLKKTNIPILATMPHNAQFEERALSCGAADVVTRPYIPSLLKRRIENIIKISNSFFYENLVNSALLNTTVNVWQYDIVNHVVYQTESSRRIHGFDPVVVNVPEAFINSGYIDPISREDFRELYRKIDGGAKTASGTFLVKTANSNMHDYWWELITYTTFFDENNTPVSAIGISEDVTAHKLAELKYRQERQLKNSIIEDCIGFFEADLDDDRIQIKDECLCRFFDVNERTSYSAFIDNVAAKAVADESRDLFLNNMSTEHIRSIYINGERHMHFDVQIYHVKTHKIIWSRFIINIMQNIVNDHLTINWRMKNNDESKRMEMELRKKADRDPLTSLLNRLAFEQSVEKSLLKHFSSQSALFMIDIDNFKQINDSYGHEYGDRVLVKIALLLRSIFRSDDYICRIGGDEFCVFMPYIVGHDGIINRAAKLCESVGMCFEGEATIISCSIGIAFSPEHGSTFTQLYRNSDSAQYMAKRSGKNRYCIYTKNTPILDE